MAQHAILRFEKHKGNPARPLEAHHERQKEQYASNPDIDTSRSKYNFHIVKPEGRYYHFIQNRIEQAGCRTRKDSTRFVDTLITASPEFFKKKSPKEIQAFFQRAADFLIGRVGRENIVSAVVHMDEKTPHLHLCFTPITEDGRLSAGHARALVTLSARQQQAAAETVVKDALSVRQTELLVKKLTAEKKEKPPKDALSVNYVEEAARELGEKLGRPCRIVNGKKKGRIELEYYGTDDLNALLEALEKLGKR